MPAFVSPTLFSSSPLLSLTFSPHTHTLSHSLASSSLFIRFSSLLYRSIFLLWGPLSSYLWVSIIYVLPPSSLP